MAANGTLASPAPPRRRTVTSGDAAAAVHAVLAEPDRLTLMVQPIVDLSEPKVAGYEVLTRLPTSWGVEPEDFFAAANRLGCSAQVGVLVLTRMQRLRATCPPSCFLTVNLSPRDLADPDVQAEFGQSWAGVVLELTESAWPDDEAAVLAGVELAREAGAKIASDDVGAGYAGLLQLVRLRPDLVKVDRGLVSRLGTDPAAESVLRSLGELASKLDAWLLVEGVETHNQLAIAMRLGVPLAQGWLFGRAAAPWPDPPELSGVGSLQLASVLTDTVAAFQRHPYPGEVLCDLDGRPVSVQVDGARVAAMTLAPSTTVSAAVERALHRPDRSQRLAPLTVTDARGQLVGLVDVEALVLAQSRTHSARTPSAS